MSELKPEVMSGGKPMQRVGSRRQVKIFKTAKMTPGGLTAKDLVVNKHGRVVSKAKHDIGATLLLNLTRKGWYTKKGKFGSKQNMKRAKRDKKNKTQKKGRKGRKMKGGMSEFSADKPLEGGEEKEAFEGGEEKPLLEGGEEAQ